MLDIFWKTGRMTINMEHYFPCPVSKLKKLHKWCIRDCINYDEVKKKLIDFFSTHPKCERLLEEVYKWA